MRAKPKVADPRQLSLFDGPVPAAEPPVASGPDHAHPQANREVTLGPCRVGYQLRRARRRSIGFVVSGDGLVVNAPRWATRQHIEEALDSKRDWILRKLAEQRDRMNRIEAGRIVWRDGAHLPFLGAQLAVQLDPQVVGAMLDPGAAQGKPLLRVGLPPDAQPTQIRDAVQGWLQRQALRLFGERCCIYAERLGVRMTRLALSSAQTRWGSASADGSIRLNWRLVHFGLPVIDYVVAHELAHLREMNHSAAFWDIVRSVVPEYQQARGRLKDVVLPTLD